MNNISNAVEPLDPAVFAAALANEHVADIVERLNAEPPETASAVLLAMPLERAAEVLDEPGLEHAAESLVAQPVTRAIELLKTISADRRAKIFRHLEAPARDQLLAELDVETRESLNQLLSYPENTAGSIMTTEFVGVPSTWTVAETLQYVRRVESTRETIYAIYVLDPKTKALVRAISLRRLITGEPQQPVLSICPPRRPLTVSPLADREDVARLISKYDLLAVPVVDKKGHVLGIVTVDDIIDAMIEESAEDVQKFGGVEALDAPYMEIGFLEMIRKRAGWLCARRSHPVHPAYHEFGRQLRFAGDLADYPRRGPPGGTLARLWRVALRELPTGVMLGSILGVIGMIRMALWQNLGIFDYGEHWILVACTVGAALVGIVTFGSLAGSMLPFILKRMGSIPRARRRPSWRRSSMSRGS